MKHTLCATVLTLMPTLGHAVDFRMMIDRDPEAVELFIQIPIGLVPAHIGALPDGFIGDDNTVDISPFRDGTFDQGDYIFQGVTASVGGVPVAFESMSMMVHPLEFDLPFTDPIDAMTAISVCNVPDPLARFHVDGMRAYLGYIAYPVDGYAEVKVTFPYASEVEVLEFRDGRPAGTQVVRTDTDKPIQIAENRPPQGWFAWLWN